VNRQRHPEFKRFLAGLKPLDELALRLALRSFLELQDDPKCRRG
jgi:hypothetical protein